VAGLACSESHPVTASAAWHAPCSSSSSSSRKPHLQCLPTPTGHAVPADGAGGCLVCRVYNKGRFNAMNTWCIHCARIPNRQLTAYPGDNSACIQLLPKQHHPSTRYSTYCSSKKSSAACCVCPHTRLQCCSFYSRLHLSYSCCSMLWPPKRAGGTGGSFFT
jgi:hypothetical protein